MEMQALLGIWALSIVCYWAFISIVGFKIAKSYFLRVRKLHLREIPTKFRAFMRKQETAQDQKKILIGCFVRLPYQFFIMTTMVIVLSLLSILNLYKILPSKIVELYRKYYGRWILKLCASVQEEFDANERISTPIVISNHSTWMEIIYYGMYPQLLSFVAKSELQKMPLLNSIPQYFKCLYVDRDSSQNRNQTLNKIRERVDQFDRNQQKTPLIIYPQGTVSNGKSLLKFKNGAFDTLSAITIFSLRFQGGFFEPHMADIKPIQSYFLLLAIRCSLTAKKCVMKPKQNETVAEYRERCRQKLAEMGDYRLQESSYQDLKEYLNFIMESPQGYRIIG